MRRNTYQFGWLELKPRTNGSDVWVYRYREREPDGTCKKRAVEIGTIERLPTEAAALKAAERLRAKANFHSPERRLLTFGALVDKYVDEEMPARISTRTHYLPWIRNYIKPRWDSSRIETITPLAVRDWLRQLPLAKKSKRHIRGLMKRAFDFAMLLGVIDVQQNPISLVRITATPDEEEVVKRVLTPEEFEAIVNEIVEPYRTMVLVAGCLGLRVSEILGLQWGDFDWEHLELKIQRAVVLGQVGRVKTSASKSRMPLDPDLAAVLHDYMLRTAPSAAPTDWVFSNPATGKPWWPSRIQQRYLRRAGMKVFGEPIGWHNFRHTFSTLLNSLGTDVKVQQELLRHADVRTTLNIYTQAVNARKREAASKLVQMVLPRRPKADEGANCPLVPPGRAVIS